MSDLDTIKNILLNLTSNAIKFTKSGVVALDGGLRIQNDETIMWCSVSDTGTGISKAVQKKIFQPFVQADQSIAERIGGTGLGLAICSQLAEKLHGKISVTSEVEYGSRFLVEIPVNLAPAEALETPPPGEWRIINFGSEAAQFDDDRQVTEFVHVPVKNINDIAQLYTAKALARFDIALVDRAIIGKLDKDAAVWQMFRDAQLPPVLIDSSDCMGLDELSLRAAFASVIPPNPSFDRLRSVINIGASFTRRHVGPAQMNPQSNRKSARILIADDNRTNQLVLETILTSAGHSVQSAIDGQTAFEIMQAEPFDLVFLDVNMPNVDGIECCRMWRQIEKRGAHLPIIGLTADSTEETQRRCLNAGMNQRLTKPVDSQSLLRLIDEFTAEVVAAAAPTASDYGLQNVLAIDRDRQPAPDPLDRAYLKSLAALGDPDFVREIAALYVSDAMTTMEKFRAAWQVKDVEAFRFQAHAFKSGAANIGATCLAKICGRIENIPQSEFERDGEMLTENVASELERVVEALEKLQVSSDGSTPLPAAKTA
ncbi:MAG: response regulator [Parasphingorhabdus sp.]|nr:response regulator [Parasphingorhabdus sp.]